MSEILHKALERFESGNLDDAALLFEQALALEPSNAAALHSLGVIQNQRGDSRRAIELLSRAVALRPNVPNFYVNLAEAYRTLGESKRAESCCRIGLELFPTFAEGLNTLGLVLHGQCRFEEAADHFRRATELRPDMAPAHNNLGLALQELGLHDEAIAQFRIALEISPDLYRSRTNLGLALLKRGQAEEALRHFQEAIRHQPEIANLHHNLGNALRILDKLVEARAAYLEALVLDHGLALTRLHIGLTLRREGKFGDALPWHKKAIELDPNNPNGWKHLAELYRERDEPELAIPCWERVLSLSPDDQFAVYIGLGNASQDEGRISRAMEHYRTAASLQPDSSLARINIGSVYEITGDMAEAEAAFREAIRLQPDSPIAHARLATLLREKLPGPELRALEERLADPTLEPHPRARLLFALAHVLDAGGSYQRAAECMRQANSLTLDHPKDYRTYIPADHERFVGAVLRGFDRRFFERTSGAGLESRRPVFVFGLPRSGTTLIEQILASHPRVHGAGELRLGRQTFESIPVVLGRSDPPIECVPHLDATTIHQLAEQHLDKLRLLDDGRAERIVDKMPDNYLFLGLLVALFPKGVFIHCCRDFRDVAVSCWITDFRSIRWANHVEHIASRCKEYSRLKTHWQSVLPQTVQEVRYEDTVEDLERVTRRLLTACELEWDPSCLEFYRTPRAVRTASITQVRQPIYKKSVARWRNYHGELTELFESLPFDTTVAPSGQSAHDDTANGNVETSLNKAEAGLRPISNLILP